MTKAYFSCLVTQPWSPAVRKKAAVRQPQGSDTVAAAPAAAAAAAARRLAQIYLYAFEDVQMAAGPGSGTFLSAHRPITLPAFRARSGRNMTWTQ